MDEEETNTDAPLQSDQEQTTEDPSDKLTPEHPRFKAVVAKNHELEGTIGSLKTELAALKESIATRQEASGDTTLSYDEQQALDRIDKGLRARGYVTQEQVAADRKVIETSIKYDKLSTKYDGTDGRPKFDPLEVTAYAKQHDLGENYEAAYREMHWDALVEYQAKRASGAIKAPNSERPGSSDRGEPETGLTDEKIANMTDSEYEKNREKILASVKANA